METITLNCRMHYNQIGHRAKVVMRDGEVIFKARNWELYEDARAQATRFIDKWLLRINRNRIAAGYFPVTVEAVWEDVD